MDQPDAEREADPLDIVVNERRVEVPTHQVTGLQIKEAAVAQGLPIQVDFVLSEELGERRTRVIGNAEVVHVHEGSRFLAIPPDDNS